MIANPIQERRLAPAAALFGPDDPYARFLSDNRDRVFYLKPWNGNSGDLLIWLGTERLLADLHVRRTLDPRRADTILIPGGNQTMWQGNIEVWKETWSRWPGKDFVVGPTTVWLGLSTWDREVRQAGRQVRAIFTRDPGSQAILQSCGFDGALATGLSHDPALYLRDSALLSRHRRAASNDFVLAAFRADREGTKSLRMYLGRWAGLVPECLRRPVEERGCARGRQSKIARVVQGTRSTRPLRVCDASTYPLPYFLETVRSADEVHTDRLHVMLLAAMLGKPTFAYPTSFGKLEAIYEHSLKSWAHVEFIRDAKP